MKWEEDKTGAFFQDAFSFINPVSLKLYCHEFSSCRNTSNLVLVQRCRQEKLDSLEE
jgi:hypothetical protein